MMKSAVVKCNDCGIDGALMDIISHRLDKCTTTNKVCKGCKTSMKRKVFRGHLMACKNTNIILTNRWVSATTVMPPKETRVLYLNHGEFGQVFVEFSDIE